jgi:RNA polymerase sigma factor (TIGR02999 family)
MEAPIPLTQKPSVRERPPLTSDRDSAPEPPATTMGDVTVLLRRSAGDDQVALDQLFTLLYDELRRLARWVRRGRAGETLATSDLVHEAFLKLTPSRGIDWRDRAHFFGVAARAMRQVLVDAARRRMAQKRGSGEWFVTLTEDVAEQPMRPEQLLALDEALNRLAALDPRQARMVEFRFFAGLSIEETAEALGISPPTVKRDWRAARAWIAAQLGSHEL